MADEYANHRAVRVALNVLRVAESQGKAVSPVVQVLEEAMAKRRMPFVPRAPVSMHEREMVAMWRAVVSTIGTEDASIDPCEEHPHGKGGTRYYAAGICVGWSPFPVGGGPTPYDEGRGLVWWPRFTTEKR